MADNIIESIVRLVTDKASARAVKTEIASVQKSLGQLGVAAGNSVSRTRSHFDTLKNEVRSADREVHTLLDTIERLGNTNASPRVSVRSSGGAAGRGFDVGHAGSLFSAVGGLNSLGGGAAAQIFGEAGQIGDVIEGLQRFGASMGQIAVAAPLATAALVGISLAMAEFNKIIDAGKASLDVALTAQDNYYAALREGLTSDEVRQRMAELQQVMPFLTQQINETQSQIDSARRQLVEQYGEVGARIAEASGQTPITQLEARLKELRAEFEANNQSIVRFSQGLGEGAFLQNDIAATLEKANETAAESREVINRLREEGIERLNDSIVNVLGNIVGVLSEIPNDLEQYTDLATRAADAQAAYNATLAEGQGIVSSLAAESETAQNRIREEGNQEARDLADEYNYDRIEAERDLQRELERIRDAANLEQLNAIGDRDALAFHLSEQTEDTELRQAEDAAEDQERQRKHEYETAMRNLARSISDRLRAEQDGLRRRLEQAEAAWRSELDTRRQALEAAQQQLNNFVTSEQNILNTLATGVMTVAESVQTSVDSMVTNALTRLADLAQAAVADLDTSSGVGAAGSQTGGYTPSANARGGNVSAGEWSWVGEEGPELVRFNRAGRVFSNAQSRQIAGGGNTINIDVADLSDRSIRRVVNEVDRAMRAARNRGVGRRSRAAA